MSESSQNDQALFILIILIVVGISLQKLAEELVLSEVIRTGGLFLALTCGPVGFLWMLGSLWSLAVERREAREKAFEREISLFAEKQYGSVRAIGHVKKKLKLLQEDALAPKFSKVFKDTYKALDEQAEALVAAAGKKAREKQAGIEAEEQARIETQEEYEREVCDEGDRERLIEYFFEVNSAKAIPSWAIEYSQRVISQARWKFNYEKRQERNRAERWLEIKAFVTEHKGFPPDFRELDFEEQNQYRQAMEQLEAGTLNDPLPEDRELAEKLVIEAKRLSPEQRERFVRDYGYKHYPFITLEGKRGNNLLIKNLTNESDYHFCLKQLFAGLHPSAELEWSAEGMRTDIAFFVGDKKVAVEIETGKNNDKQLAKKRAWLDKQFTDWIIVCPRDQLPRYRRFVDGKKSRVLTIKHASLQLHLLLS